MLFRRKKQPDISQARKRKEAVELLEAAGYFVRRPKIRKPKVGDIVRFRVGAGWSINTHYYQTGEVVSFGDGGANSRPHLRDNYINVEKRNKRGDLIASHTVEPHMVVSVSSKRIEVK